jgi:hypothetical protein
MFVNWNGVQGYKHYLAPLFLTLLVCMQDPSGKCDELRLVECILPCDCRQGKIDIGVPAMRFFFCRSTNIQFEEKTYDASFVSLFYPKSHCTFVLSFALEVVVFLNYAPIVVVL